MAKKNLLSKYLGKEEDTPSTMAQEVAKESKTEEPKVEEKTPSTMAQDVTTKPKAEEKPQTPNINKEESQV